jgi:hypothetical protein
MRRSFKAGDIVSHSRFGLGAIEDEWGSWVDIDDKGNELMVNGAGIYEVQFESEAKPRSINGSWLSLEGGRAYGHR